jgi:hypothetical protein
MNAAKDAVTIKVNGRPVILRRKTRMASFRGGLIKDWGKGFAMLANWAWVCLPKTEWARYPEPIDLAEHLPDDGAEAAEFAGKIAELFDGPEDEAGNSDGGASLPSPASPSESSPESGKA